MKPKRVTLTVLILSCILLSQASCEEQTMTQQELSPEWFTQQHWPTQQQSQPRMAPQNTQRMQIMEPKIVFEKLTHHFGEVGPGTDHLCEFRFRNAGNSTLYISEVEKTCGCTPFLLEKKQYAPGESGTIKVRYYTESEYGNTTKQLIVRSNDRQNPNIALALQARVVSKIKTEPGNLNLTLNHQNAGCPQITISSIDNQPFSIRSFKSTGNCITANFNPSMKATRFVLQPVVDLNRLEQVLNGRIEIDTTHPQCRTVSLGLNTLARFRSSPQSIVVRNIRPNQTVTKSIQILNNYNEDFGLVSATSRKGIATVSGYEKTTSGYELKLNIRAPETSGRASVFSDLVSVKLTDGRNLNIPCNGFYQRGRTTQASSGEQKEEECRICKPHIFNF
ncbi:MAG: DUF1573 domain-containing protein [Phycisphaerales bacterium]|jgi:hypothetical protein